MTLRSSPGNTSGMAFSHKVLDNGNRVLFKVTKNAVGATESHQNLIPTDYVFDVSNERVIQRCRIGGQTYDSAEGIDEGLKQYLSNRSSGEWDCDRANLDTPFEVTLQFEDGQLRTHVPSLAQPQLRNFSCDVTIEFATYKQINPERQEDHLTLDYVPVDATIEKPLFSFNRIVDGDCPPYIEYTGGQRLGQWWKLSGEGENIRSFEVLDPYVHNQGDPVVVLIRPVGGDPDSKEGPNRNRWGVQFRLQYQAQSRIPYEW